MIWLYDDSYDGLLTAIFCAFAHNGDSNIRAVGRNDEPSLFDSQLVTTDCAKADRVTRGMQRLDPLLSHNVYRAFLSQLPSIEDSVLAMLRLGFAQNTSPLDQLQHPAVHAVFAAVRRVGYQAERYVGLTRLHKINDQLYAADIEPDVNVLPLIGQHFHDRYGGLRILIRDVRRRLVLVSDANGWHITSLPPGPLPPLPTEPEMNALWRGYFKAIANPHRTNINLQQKFVPKKVRKHMVEFNNE